MCPVSYDACRNCSLNPHLVKKGVVRIVGGPDGVKIVPLHGHRVQDHGLQRHYLAPNVVVLVSVRACYRDRPAVDPQLSPRDLDLAGIDVQETKQENGLVLLRDISRGSSASSELHDGVNGAARCILSPCSETMRRTQEQHGPASRDEATVARALDRFLSKSVYGTAPPALSKPHHARGIRRIYACAFPQQPLGKVKRRLRSKFASPIFPQRTGSLGKGSASSSHHQNPPVRSHPLHPWRPPHA